MRVRVVAAALLAVALLVGAVPAGALSEQPAYPGDFPDPFVLASGGAYWAYSTGSAGKNLQAMRSADLATWDAPVDPLPTLPRWASPFHTWAPSVIAVGGAFVMYYTVRETTSGRQCVSVATASTPAGPFTDNRPGPLVCQYDHYGSIDPQPFVVGGDAYLLWKSDDNAAGGLTQLWAQKLSADRLSLVGQRRVLLSRSRAWQGPLIEGPAMIADRDTYYLFYGANDWFSANAGIGYATCSSPLGPCVERSTSGPWLGSHGSAVGPSGPATFTDGAGRTRFAYHAWSGGPGYEQGGVRSLWIDTLSFRRGAPVLS